MGSERKAIIMRLPRQTTDLAPRASSRTGWAAVLLMTLGLLAPGCGITADSSTGSVASQVVSGLPRCDESLLHPRISVGGVASMPGKLIVYVDGIMACVDDAAKVDQIVTRVESRFPQAPLRDGK